MFSYVITQDLNERVERSKVHKVQQEREREEQAAAKLEANKATIEKAVAQKKQMLHEASVCTFYYLACCCIAGVFLWDSYW